MYKLRDNLENFVVKLNFVNNLTEKCYKGFYVMTC